MRVSEAHCNVLQHAATHSLPARVREASLSALPPEESLHRLQVQCVAVCCSVLQRIAVYCSMLHRAAACCSVLQCGEVCCSVVQRVAVWCRVV